VGVFLCKGRTLADVPDDKGPALEAPPDDTSSISILLNSLRAYPGPRLRSVATSAAAKFAQMERKRAIRANLPQRNAAAGMPPLQARISGITSSSVAAPHLPLTSPAPLPPARCDHTSAPAAASLLDARATPAPARPCLMLVYRKSHQQLHRTPSQPSSCPASNPPTLPTSRCWFCATGAAADGALLMVLLQALQRLELPSQAPNPAAPA
jgi:hypothetical protein